MNNKAAIARHSKAAIAWDALNLRSRTALLKRILSNPAGAASYASGNFERLGHLRDEVAGRLIGWN